jgi:hypothetical protein
LLKANGSLDLNYSRCPSSTCQTDIIISKTKKNNAKNNVFMLKLISNLHEILIGKL